MEIGRYEVVLPLGEGPTHRVLLARDPTLGRQVALKVLRADAALPGEARARLVARIRESARAIAGISHPGFSSLYDMGDDVSGAPYLVFEFVKGPTLRERLVAGPLPPAEVASIGRALGAALTHAHAADFVHGDVKPENVMLSAVGTKLTEPGFAWLAREQSASPHDDQLALAALLYEALTGKAAFATGTRQPPSAVAPHLRSFPHLDTIFDRALASDPRKRFSSCDVLGGVVATELEGVESGRLAPASVSSIVPRATRRWQNAAAGAAVLVICALVVLGRRSPGDPRTTPAASSGPASLDASGPSSSGSREPEGPSPDGSVGADRIAPSRP